MKVLKSFFSIHGKHILTLTFFAGFIIDFITLPDISNPLYPYIGIFYISLVGISILVRERLLVALRHGRGSHKLMNIMGIVSSYALGSLLSYVFIYYIRSGDVFTSWPLYILLFSFVFVNEFSFQTSTKLLINISLMYIGIVFFSVFNLPLVLKEVSDATFIKSLILGFLVCYAYSSVLSLGLYNKKLSFKVYFCALLVPVFVAGLYFTNIIPAVPLTLRDANVYSSVNKNTSGNYDFKEVKQTKELLFGLDYKDHVLMNTPGTLYFFGAVQAPAEVNSSISHVWQKKDQVTKKWITKQTNEFTIVGGRKQGYRGFTLMNNITKGEYRVVVMVGGKRSVGEKKFIVE